MGNSTSRPSTTSSNGNHFGNIQSGQIKSTLPFTNLNKMFLIDSLRQCSWLTLTLFGIGVYYLLKKLIERIRITDPTHKAVFITNCDYDIGQKIALKCAKYGFMVYAGFSRLESRKMLEQKAIQAKINLITVPIDLTDEQTISQAVEFVKKDLPADIKLWSLINTPSEHNEYDDNHLDTFKSVMELNYLSEIRCTHAFIPLIKKSKGGRIAITKSISEELILRWGNTQVPKTALNTFLEQLAMELHHTKIKVGVFEPGVFKSNYLNQSAIQKRVDQLSRKISVEERQKLVEYKSKIMSHSSNVFERHGVTSSESVVKAYFHFVTALLPYTYYKCGPSILLRSVWLYVLSWLNTIMSSLSLWPKQKDF